LCTTKTGIDHHRHVLHESGKNNHYTITVTTLKQKITLNKDMHAAIKTFCDHCKTAFYASMIEDQHLFKRKQQKTKQNKQILKSLWLFSNFFC
jgi:hypothetical protein